MISVALIPLIPTGDFPPPLMPPPRWRLLRPNCVAIEQRWLILCPCSPALLSRPADWPDLVHLTGSWFLDRPEQWQPPADLTAFLAAGPPPVYVGFGSMFGTSQSDRRPPGWCWRRWMAAARCWPKDGGGLDRNRLPDAVFGLPSAPHDWLFPRMTAIVHHGGTTTTTAARAGLPNVIVPFLADQPLWGDRLHRLGTASRPIPRRRLTSEALATTLAATDNPEMRRRAAALGERVRAENGIAEVIHLIERAASRGGEV